MHAPEGRTIEVVVRPVFSFDSLRQFTPSSQEIGLKLTTLQQRYQQMVVIRVQDNGKGIPTQHLTRVFDPFYRVDTRLIRETHGTHSVSAYRRAARWHDLGRKRKRGRQYILRLSSSGWERSKRVESRAHRDRKGP